MGREGVNQGTVGDSGSGSGGKEKGKEASLR